MRFVKRILDILGDNNASNGYSTSAVTSNSDGSVLERLEALKGSVAGVSAGVSVIKGVADAGTNSTTTIPISGLAGYGNDFFNNDFYMQVLHNYNSAGNAPEYQVRKITDYVSSSGTFTVDAFGAAVEASDICLILHESLIALGRNDNNNIFDSSSVAANVDGSILERLEDLKDRINTIDDYVDTEIASIISALTTIGGYVSGTDGAANFIGANNNNNTVATDQVASNADGSILERLEDIKDRVDTVDNYIDTEIAAIKAVTDVIPDAGALTAFIAKVDAIQTDLGNPSARTNLQTIQAMLGNPDTAAQSIWDCLTGSGGIASFPAGVAAANDVSIAEVLRFIQECLRKGTGGTAIADNKSIVDILGSDGTTVTDSAVSVLGAIGANNADNAFNSSTVAANVDGSVLERLEDIKDRIDAVDNYVDTEITALQTAIDNFAAGGGDGKAIVRKTVTFANTAADVNLFSITGGVNFKLYAFCTTNVESAGGCNIGVDLGSTAIVADTDCTALEANDLWHDATPTTSAEAESNFTRYTAYGGTLVLDVEGAKQVDSGVIVFVCVYTPLTADGAVAAA